MAICKEIAVKNGVVEAVNFNCPGQVVIAGATKAVEAAMEALKQAGAKRAMPLPVSAPFHSTLMKPAAARLATELDKITIADAKIPVVANVNGQIVSDGARIKASLVRAGRQSSAVGGMRRPDYWPSAQRPLLKSVLARFLAALRKKLPRMSSTLNVEDIASLQKTLDYFKEVR